MGANKRSFEQMRQDDINENLHEGVNMYFTPPKEEQETIDYSLNDFEGLVKYASKYTTKERNLILDAIIEYKRLMDQF